MRIIDADDLARESMQALMALYIDHSRLTDYHIAVAANADTAHILDQWLKDIEDVLA